MNIKEAIKHRRLIKTEHFNGQLIDDAIIHELLEYADWAPTHAHTEPWRFVVYTQDKIKGFCLDHANLYQQHCAAESFSSSVYQKIAHRGDKASHLIVCYTKKGTNHKVPMIEEVAAVSCAIQNLWLLAASYNIGVYWGSGGMTHHHSMKDYFQLQAEDVMMGLLFLGYTDQEWPVGKRVQALSEKVTWK